MAQLSGSLIIRQVTVEDGGKYVCLISNSAGEERTEMLLIVTGMILKICTTYFLLKLLGILMFIILILYLCYTYYPILMFILNT